MRARARVGGVRVAENGLDGDAHGEEQQRVEEHGARLRAQLGLQLRVSLVHRKHQRLVLLLRAGVVQRLWVEVHHHLCAHVRACVLACVRASE